VIQRSGPTPIGVAEIFARHPQHEFRRILPARRRDPESGGLIRAIARGEAIHAH